MTNRKYFCFSLANLFLVIESIFEPLGNLLYGKKILFSFVLLVKKLGKNALQYLHLLQGQKHTKKSINIYTIQVNSYLFIVCIFQPWQQTLPLFFKIHKNLQYYLLISLFHCRLSHCC